MKVTMLLADAAQAVNGKLYILGGGWSIVGLDPTPTAIALKIDVPWDQANRPHTLALALLDSDGRPVMVENRPVEFRGDFEAGRPAGLVPGSDLDVAVAVSMGPLPLAPGRRYVWRCAIDDESREEWQVAFQTRAR
jgi:hypothetical protein